MLDIRLHHLWTHRLSYYCVSSTLAWLRALPHAHSNGMCWEAVMGARVLTINEVLAGHAVLDIEAADERQLTKTIARYGRVDLLCIDLCRPRDYAEGLRCRFLLA